MGQTLPNISSATATKCLSVFDPSVGLALKGLLVYLLIPFHKQIKTPNHREAIASCS